MEFCHIMGFFVLQRSNHFPLSVSQRSCDREVTIIHHTVDGP
jgi:hypothetical protein